MVDRRSIGIVVFAIISSSAIFTLFVGEKVEEPIEILKNEWNLPPDPQGTYRLPGEEGRFAHGIGLVVRRPVHRLEIFYATLENETLAFPPVDTLGSPWEILLETPEVGDLLATMDDYAGSTKMRLVRADFQVDVASGEKRGYVVDVTDPGLGVAPRNVSRTLHTVHAILLDEQGRATQYYKGYPDFFLSRDPAIIDLTIQLNQNMTKYAHRITAQEASLEMEKAPPVGHVVFEDLKTDDQIFINIAINPALIRTKKAILHVVVLFVDGEYHTGMASIITRGRII